jgi:hypothetical protein
MDPIMDLLSTVLLHSNLAIPLIIPLTRIQDCILVNKIMTMVFADSLGACLYCLDKYIHF